MQKEDTDTQSDGETGELVIDEETVLSPPTGQKVKVRTLHVFSYEITCSWKEKKKENERNISF